MARLKVLKPRLRALPASRLKVAQGREEVDRQRNAQPWRGWYKLGRWRKLRWDVLVRDGFTCQRCGRLEANTAQLVADHREPHRGDAALFWDRENLQALCKPCHDRAKQREERRSL